MKKIPYICLFLALLSASSSSTGSFKQCGKSALKIRGFSVYVNLESEGKFFFHNIDELFDKIRYFSDIPRKNIMNFRIGLEIITRSLKKLINDPKVENEILCLANMVKSNTYGSLERREKPKDEDAELKDTVEEDLFKKVSLTAKIAIKAHNKQAPSLEKSLVYASTANESIISPKRPIQSEIQESILSGISSTESKTQEAITPSTSLVTATTWEGTGPSNDLHPTNVLDEIMSAGFLQTLSDFELMSSLHQANHFGEEKVITPEKEHLYGNEQNKCCPLFVQVKESERGMRLENDQLEREQIAVYSQSNNSSPLLPIYPRKQTNTHQEASFFSSSNKQVISMDLPPYNVQEKYSPASIDPGLLKKRQPNRFFPHIHSNRGITEPQMSLVPSFLGMQFFGLEKDTLKEEKRLVDEQSHSFKSFSDYQKSTEGSNQTTPPSGSPRTNRYSKHYFANNMSFKPYPLAETGFYGHDQGYSSAQVSPHASFDQVSRYSYSCDDSISSTKKSQSWDFITEKSQPSSSHCLLEDKNKFLKETILTNISNSAHLPPNPPVGDHRDDQFLNSYASPSKTQNSNFITPEETSKHNFVEKTSQKLNEEIFELLHREPHQYYSGENHLEISAQNSQSINTTEENIFSSQRELLSLLPQDMGSTDSKQKKSATFPRPDSN